MMSSDVNDLAKLGHEVSNWGRWGNDDQLGTLNLISPAARVRAAARVTEGRLVSLGRRLELGTRPETPQSVHAVWKRPGEHGAAAEFVGLAFHGQSVTHIDALSHVHYQSTMYNGFSTDEISQFGAAHLTVEVMAESVAGRGVLLDIPRLYGVETLERSASISAHDLDRAVEQQGLSLEQGDLVFVRSGTPYMSYADGAPGLDASCVRWLHSNDVAVIGSDVGNDKAPGNAAIHRVGIPFMGLALVDNCDLGPIARECAELGRYDFFAVVAPARAVGATGWPVNPLAIL
jgi:kynurenine formamidase